jgi:hypothetical protein
LNAIALLPRNADVESKGRNETRLSHVPRVLIGHPSAARSSDVLLVAGIKTLSGLCERVEIGEAADQRRHWQACGWWERRKAVVDVQSHVIRHQRLVGEWGVDGICWRDVI